MIYWFYYFKRKSLIYTAGEWENVKMKMGNKCDLLNNDGKQQESVSKWNKDCPFVK